MGIFKRVLKKSCEGSSMKALPRIMRSPTTFQRTLWVLGLLVGLVAAIYQLVKLLMGYLQYETSVNIVEVQGAPPFPDVTVCHLDTTWTFRVLQNELNQELTMAHYQARVERLQEHYPEGSDDWATLEMLKGLPGYLQNVPLHHEVEQLRDLFIIDCAAALEWEPKHCFGGGGGMLNTSVFLDPWFGLCVTFKVTDEDVKGLNLVLYLDDPEDVDPQVFNLTDDTKTHTSTVGARVVVHPKDSFPDIWLASQHVHAGTDMAFNIEGTQRTVLDTPYGSCISAEEARAAKEAGEPGYAINRHGYECYRMCAKDHILKECECLHVYYVPTQEDRASTALCGYLDEHNVSATMSYLSCAERTTLALYEGFQQKCGCPIPCLQFLYEYTTKAIEWPHDTYHLSFYEQYIRPAKYAAKFDVYDGLLNLSRTDGRLAQSEVSKLSLIQRNFAQVRVLNHQRTYFHYSETPLISPEALFGNVGGLLNLWVGITFITIIEIIDFAHQLFTQNKMEDSRRRAPQNGTGQHPPDTTDGLLKTT